ncbi:MAG: hypothetical protein PHN75_09370 [Syntrophales bacterium]|nr:hypothetical protein [Syntrophales bacterium]
MIIVLYLIIIAILSTLGSKGKPWRVASSLILGIALFFGFALWNLRTCDVLQSVATPLYAGYNDSEISGRYFLSSGTVNDVAMVYYWVDNNGVKSRYSQKMDQSVFIEDGKNEMIEIYKMCPKKWRWFFLPLNELPQRKRFEFHVPEHSIPQMYQYH